MADDWEQIDSGGWIDTGEAEPAPAAAAPKTTSTLAKAAAAPKPAPSPGRGFFDTFFAGEFWSIGFIMVVLLLVGLTWYAYSSNNVGLTGIVIGVLIGFGFQKGRFCIYMAHREILLMKNWEMMKALVLTMLLIMVGYLFVSDLGIGLQSDFTNGTFTAIAPRPAIWLAALVGGFIFGIGTVLAGGCAAGTAYRAGEGYIGNMVAVVTLMLGASIGMFGVLKPLVDDLKKTVFTYTPLGATDPISNPSLYDILLKDYGIGAWETAAAIIVLVAIIWILKFGFSMPQIMPKGGLKLENIMKRKWTKWKAGVFIAFVVIGGLLTHSAAQALSSQGHNYSVCAACGLVRFTHNYFSTNGNIFEWSGLMMVGLVLGAFISAQFSGEFGLRVPDGIGRGDSIGLHGRSYTFWCAFSLDWQPHRLVLDCGGYIPNNLLYVHEKYVNINPFSLFFFYYLLNDYPVSFFHPNQIPATAKDSFTVSYAMISDDPVFPAMS